MQRARSRKIEVPTGDTQPYFELGDRAEDIVGRRRESEERDERDRREQEERERKRMEREGKRKKGESRERKLTQILM